MIGAIEVKVVEESPTLHTLIALLGPIVVLAGAVLAAWYAARQAGLRQERELAHDREVRRDEYRRDVLDAALELASRLHNRFAAFHKHVDSAEEARKEQEAILARMESGEEPNDPGLRQRIQMIMGEIGSSFHMEFDRDLFPWLTEFEKAVGVRLEVRFGRRHPVMVRADELMSAWQNLEAVQRPAMSANLDSDQRAAMEAAYAHATVAYDAFFDSCKAWLSGEYS